MAAGALAQDDYAAERAAMIDTIEAHAETMGEMPDEEGVEQQVLDAMSEIPRHEFVPERRQDEAYADRPVPIGYGQTISQPFIVALMTDLLNVEADDKVLEVGTGSGYQAAVLSPLTDAVYTIEIIPELGETATDRLGRFGFDNVETRIGDGYYGWEAAAPFDGIVVTAAASHIPPPLVQQLAAGARMVIPVGDQFTVQQLMLVEKEDDGTVTTRQLMPVRFVPLTGTR